MSQKQAKGWIKTVYIDETLVGKRIDNPGKFWQMPQGGVDRNEDYLNAAFRELKEETSIENVDLIKEIDEMTTYELPNNLLGIIWKGNIEVKNKNGF